MTDTAKLRVVNAALGALGQEPASDLSEASLQGSVSLVKLMRHIEDARDAVLTRHGWVRALQFATLTPATVRNLVDWRYPTAFLAPGDCLRVWEIAGECWSAALAGGWGPRWQVGTVDFGDTARTIIRAGGPQLGGVDGLTQLDVVYVRRASWASLDQPLRDAVAADLAKRGAYSITGDRNIADGLAKLAEDMVMKAVGVDGTQEGGQPPAAPSIPQAIRHMSR